MIKRAIVSSLMLVMQIILYAQNSGQNQEKYWYYRYRLLNNFMLVGDCQGCSTPASTRGEFTYDQLYWGDGTIDLGWYIGVLATECKLLMDNNQDASQTVKELYYALEAFNRLDFNAEIYLSSGTLGGDLNGFFIRDDVHPGFIGAFNLPFSNYPHFNSGLVETRCKILPSYCEVTQARSSFFEFDHTKPAHLPSPESLDQVCHLLMGLSLVNRCLGNGINYNDGTGVKSFMDGESDILNEARNITDRMIDWIRMHSWFIRNPVTGINLTNGEGGEAVALSYGFAEAACKATNKSDFTHAISGLTCFDYHDPITSANLLIPWEGYQNPLIFGGIVLADTYGDHLIGLLAALGNSWYLSGTVFPVNTTNAKLSLYYTTLRDREYLPLLRQVLHGGGNLVSNNRYENLLNVAPCNGPYNIDGDYGQNLGQSDEWSTQNRFKNPEDRGSSIPYPKGEFNGLDYMLLFNLYSIAKSETNSPYVSSYTDMMNRYVSINFPFSNFSLDIGSHLFPIEIKAFNAIAADNNIASDGDVTYKAGVEIALLPGFGVDAGADFAAFIGPLTCNSTGSYSKMANSTGPQPLTFNQPTSYVQNAGNSHPPLGSSNASITKAIPVDSHSPISIIPNPTSGFFTLSLDENFQNEIFIYNNLGALVYSRTVGSAEQIDLSSQRKGIYFVKVWASTPSGQSASEVYTEKVVVQ